MERFLQRKMAAPSSSNTGSKTRRWHQFAQILSRCRKGHVCHFSCSLVQHMAETWDSNCNTHSMKKMLMQPAVNPKITTQLTPASYSVSTYACAKGHWTWRETCFVATIQFPADSTIVTIGNWHSETSLKMPAGAGKRVQFDLCHAWFQRIICVF